MQPEKAEAPNCKSSRTSVGYHSSRASAGKALLPASRCRNTDTDTQTYANTHKHTSDRGTRTETRRVTRDTGRDTQRHTETRRDTQKHTHTQRHTSQWLFFLGAGGLYAARAPTRAPTQNRRNRKGPVSAYLRVRCLRGCLRKRFSRCVSISSFAVPPNHSLFRWGLSTSFLFA